MQRFSTNSSILTTPCLVVSDDDGGGGDSDRIATLLPLSTAQSRHLISLYTLGVQLDAPLLTPNDPTGMPLGHQSNGSSVDDATMNALCLPLWILVDGCDKKRTVALGAHVTQNPERNVHLIEVTSNGPVTADVLPKYSTVLHTHIQRCRVKQVQVNTSCLAEYDVFHSFCKQAPFLSSVKSPQKSLLIQLRWQQVSELQQTPPVSSIATVHTVLSVDDMQSAAYSLLSELRTLQGFCRGLDGDMVQWNYTQTTTSSVVDRVQNLINDVKQGDAFHRHQDDDTVDDGDNDFFYSVRKLILIDRQDLDFTETLWIIIKECQSYEELTECLQLVLSSLQHYHLQTMVHKSNTSTLACLIRDSYNDQLVLPPFTGTLPLQMLVEIGTEKLAADYCNVLLGKELVTSAHLTYFVERDVTLEERVIRLEKLHYVVEFVVTLEHYLNPPRPTLIEGVRTALLHYKDHSVTEIHTFVTSIATNAVTALLESNIASRWQVFHTSDVQNLSVTSSCLISTKPQLPRLSHSQTGLGTSPQQADCTLQQEGTKGPDATITETISPMYYVTQCFHSVDSII